MRGEERTQFQDWALKYVQHEWHKTAARKSSHPSHVEAMVSEMKQLSPLLVKTVVNMVDQNVSCFPSPLPLIIPESKQSPSGQHSSPLCCLPR